MNAPRIEAREELLGDDRRQRSVQIEVVPLEHGAERRSEDDLLLLGGAAQRLLHGIAGRIERGGQVLLQLRQARRLVGIQPALPDVAEQSFNDETLGAAGPGQALQGQRVEGMLGGQLQRNAQALRGPADLAEGPLPLRLQLGRTLLAPVIEQPGEQDRPVIDHDAVTLQRLGQAFEGQRRIGRDHVEVEGDVLHGPARWLELRARCPTARPR
jgi:hypothetical protein